MAQLLSTNVAGTLNVTTSVATTQILFPDGSIQASAAGVHASNIIINTMVFG